MSPFEISPTRQVGQALCKMDRKRNTAHIVCAVRCNNVLIFKYIQHLFTARIRCSRRGFAVFVFITNFSVGQCSFLLARASEKSHHALRGRSGTVTDRGGLQLFYRSRLVR